jgi:hypothetical protein
MPRDVHNHAIRHPGFAETRNGGVPEIMKPKSRKASFLNYRPPRRSPASHWARWVEFKTGHAEASFAFETKLRANRRKHIVTSFYNPESFGSPAQLPQHLIRFRI